MVDIVDPQKRSEMMSGISGKDTKPELFIRKLLHNGGFRYRLHRKDLPGKPDVVLGKWRTVLFVQGCFWHGHAHCPLFRLPKTRQEFWTAKINRNIARDDENRSKYLQTDWKLIEVWECAIKGKARLGLDEFETLLFHSITTSQQKFISIRGQPI